MHQGSDSFKSLPQLAPYLLKLEAKKKRLKLIAERIIIIRSIIPYIALVKLSSSPLKFPIGGVKGFLQDLRTLLE